MTHPLTPCYYTTVNHPAHRRYRLAGKGPARHWVCIRCCPGVDPAADTVDIARLLPAPPDSADEAGEKGNGTSGNLQKQDISSAEPGGAGSPKWRANNERAWAGVFDALGVAWRYEALEPDLSRALRYMPDFWLPDRLVWVEIKSGAPTEGEIVAARALLKATGCRVWVLSGWPRRGGFGVCVFSEVGDFMTAKRRDWCDVALCSLLDCSFGELHEAFGGVA